MAGRGPAPKDPEKRVRRNKPEAPKLYVGDGGVHGPELPPVIAWPAPTLHWWETWRRSAQAAGMVETDWDFLLDTALIHARFWSGDMSSAAELRLRVAKFGATPEDRARLKMQIGEPDQGPSERKSSARYSHLRVASSE